MSVTVAPGGLTKKAIALLASILVVSYALFFYLQLSEERRIRASLFEQHKEVQSRSLENLSQRILADLSLLEATVQGLSESAYLQSGNLAGEKAQKLVSEKYAYLSTVSKADRIFVIDAGGMVVWASAQAGAPDFIGLQAPPEWVQQVKGRGGPVFSNGYMGLDGEYRMTIAVPVVNRDSGEYLGMVALSAVTTSFFQFYGNLENIDSQFLVVYDEKGDIIASPVPHLLGKNAFSAELRQFTRNSIDVEETNRLLLSGQKVVSVYDYGTGERLNTAGPVLVNGKAEYFVQLITPTATIYSNIDTALAETRARTFLLLATATAAVAVVALFMVRHSAALERDVQSRTKQLQESNEQLAARTGELARANEELQIRDTLQQEFVNIAAHELRTPVLPIVLSAESLAETMPENESVKIILRNATRMTKLTNDILDVSRIESRSLKIKKEELGLDELLSPLVRDYGALLAEKEVALSYEPARIRVTADRSRLTQVFTNLLDNASYFTTKGRISVTVQKQAGEVAVAISDTGRGIDPEILPKLFTKFATKSEKGTGLGLYICKAIVEAHGGRMWAENNPGGGATFHFTLPA
ncbi:MAG: sensor histidine kinase [Nitrososphaera sp.]|uniref:sensor histidine kinase n=1 Tax=Nitrososphaera sp. TaxID=1971748 RepID=UPI003D6F2829